MNERTKLLRTVQMYSFAIDDAALFLDTHPECSDALTYYKRYKKLYDEAKIAYEEKYGPLFAGADENASVWKWVNDPWPWEESEGK